MIVTLTLPAGSTTVSYGQSKMLADANRQIQVPDYAAKTLLTLPGVSGPSLTDTAATLLANADQDFEANYLFWANGQQLPSSGKVVAASALMAANGEPAVSLV